VDSILATCPSDEERAQVNRDFNISFDAELLTGPYVCKAQYNPGEPGNPQVTVIQAFRVIKALQFDIPPPWTKGHSLYDWLRGAVRGVRFRNLSSSACCEPAGVINIRGDELTQPRYREWINPQAGTGMDGLVAVILHEARHAEGWPHTCGPDRDQTLVEMGAYAVQYYFHLWIAQHSAPGLFSNSYKQTAAANAEWTKQVKICKP
jgi:hypothetical protein